MLASAALAAHTHELRPTPAGGLALQGSTGFDRLAARTGLVVLYEIEGGVCRLTGRSRTLAKSQACTPGAELVAATSRFRGMDAEAVTAPQEWVNERWSGYCARHAQTTEAG